MKNFDTTYHLKNIMSAHRRNSLFFQPKLTVNNPNDKYEKEADAFADKVMGKNDSLIQARPIEIAEVQRKCGDCDEQENIQTQRKESNISDHFFKRSLHLTEHKNGPSDEEKKAAPKPITPCADSVSIGALKEFNHSNLSADDQEKWGTYLGVTSQMVVGPGPDHSGHCMKESLKTISNTCPEAVYKRDAKETEPCTGNKCLDINRYGSSGDTSTKSSLSDGPVSFIDLHRTRNPSSLLEGTGKSSCAVVCEQTYSCDRKKATKERFTITRNFKAGSHTKKDKSKMHITTGSVKKELVK